MRICPQICGLNKWFSKSVYDVAKPIANPVNCRERLSCWLSKNRISLTEFNILRKYLSSCGIFNYNGCLANGVMLLKNNQLVRRWLEYTWKMLYDLGENGQPVRLDELVSVRTLNEFSALKCAPLSRRIMMGDAFSYTDHKTGHEKHLKLVYPAYFQNKIVNPIYIGDEYNRSYKYKSEAMCLTRYFSEDGLREWINHHLNVGFEHIHIFDNESQIPCKRICAEFGDKVSYELIVGNAKHYKIFDDYINSERCLSEWIMPIDDDEYFELNRDLFSSVNECIQWYVRKFPYAHMFAIRWKHLFPKIFHSECKGSVLTYCTEENSHLASKFQRMGDFGVKTFVHRYGKIHYETTEENPSGGHVPKHSAASCALLYNGERVCGCSCRRSEHGVDEPARLIHCRYKGYQWYKNKMNDIIQDNRELDNSLGKPYTHSYRFTDILESLP